MLKEDDLKLTNSWQPILLEGNRSQQKVCPSFNTGCEKGMRA